MKTDPWQDYLKKHPDMCKFIAECKKQADPDCHKMSHKNCEVYLEKEWR